MRSEAPAPTSTDAGTDQGGRVVAFPRPHPDAQPSGDHQPRPRLREVIGDVLRDERHRQGRTLADVADAAAVSLQYLSEVERGTKEVSSDLLDAVHTALGLDLPTVLERANRRLTAGTQRGSALRMLAA